MTSASPKHIDLENSKDAILSMLANSPQKRTFTSKVSEFSNIINNATAKVQKTQTNFVDKAVKSNTSSINKFTLKKQNSKSEKDTPALGNTKNKNNLQSAAYENKKDYFDKKSISNNDSIKNVDYKDNFKDDINNEININNSTSGKVSQNSDNNNTSKVDSKNKKDSKNDLSDMNNSSPVESSPFYYDYEDAKPLDKPLNEEEKAAVKDFIGDILITLDIDLSQKEDLKIKSDELISNIETIDDVKNVVEEISSAINEMNLSQNKKDEITLKFKNLDNILKSDNEQNKFSDLLNVKEYSSDINIEIADNIERLQNDKDAEIITSSDFKELKSEILSLINEINKEISSNDIEPKQPDKTLEIPKAQINLAENDTEKNKEEIEATAKTAEKSDIKTDTKVDYKADEIIATAKKILNNPNISLSEKKELIEILKDFTAKIPDSDNSFETVNTKETVYSDIDIKDIKDFKNIPANALKIIETANQNDNITLNTDIEKAGDVLSDENLKEIFNNVIKAFDTLKDTKTYDSLTADEKNQLELVLAKISEFRQSYDKTQNAEIKTENSDIKTGSTSDSAIVKEKINNFIKEVSTTQMSQPVEDTNIQTNKNSETQVKVEFKENTNTLKFDSKAADSSEDENASFNNDASFDEEINLSNDDDFSLKTNSDIKQKEDNENIEPDIETSKQQDKTAFIDSVKEGILEEISYDDSFSSPLSVSDEIAKMALDGNNTLSVLNGKTNAPYNPLIGANMPKNFVLQAGNTPTLNENPFTMEESILNQIGNKLSELKDAQGQKMTLVLRPNNLGRLSIELTSNNQGLSANIIAQNEDVRNYIEKNINALRQQLSDSGISVNTIQIKTSGQDNASSYSGNQNHQKQENFNQNNNQNNNNNQNRQHDNSDEKSIREMLASMSNYDMHFAKDFSSLLNKSTGYTLN